MNNYKKLGNIKGKLVHIELGIEYYENDSLINPTKEQKLLWEIYGLPKNIEKIEQSSETTIDEVFGKNKKEIQDKINEKIKNGQYSYLGESPKLNLVFSEKMAKGGKIKRSKESIIADSRYKALPEGRRKSKKYATIELANGTKIRRRNANQTGDVEGGRYYSEKRPNHTDKSGKVVVSVRTKETKKVVKTSASVLKPSDSINFVGINFKRYNYTVGGL